MKILLLFCFVSICTSFPTFFEKYLNIREDGTSTFTNTNGGMMDIMRRFIDPSKKDITLKNQRATPETSRFDDSTNDLSEGTLRNILESSYPTFQGYNQADSFHGAVDDKSYNMFKNWDTEYPVDEISDVATKDEFVRIQGLHPELDVQGEKIINQELWSPRFEQFQELLKHIKFQQGEVIRDYDFPQQTTFRKYWLPEFLQNHQQFLEQYGNEAFEQDSFDQILQQWTVQQQWLNQQVEQLHPTVPVPEELIQEITEHQALLNRKAEKVIEELIHQQTVITYQIEGLLEQKQFASSDLVNRQRIVYQHIQQALERLVYQKSFIDKNILQRVQQGFSVHQQLYIQHHILSQQIYRLIQQIFFQHIHIKQQIKFFYQHEEVLPKEWIAIEKLTYQQVETFIPALIQLLTYQQEYVRHYFALIDRKGEVIPEVTVERYLNFYKKLLELTVEGDLVPKELYFKQKEVHQQIVQLVRENQEKKVTNRVVYWPQEELELSQQQPWKFFLQKQQVREYQPKQQWNTFQQSWNLFPQQKHEQELRTVLPVDNIYQRYQTVY